MSAITDPRLYPATAVCRANAAAQAAQWRSLAEAAAEAPGIRQRAAIEAELEQSIVSAFARTDIDTIRAALDAARSSSEYRQLWRAVVAGWRARISTADASVVAHGFAIPVVVVTTADHDMELPMTLSQPRAIVDAMREAGALAGNTNFGVGSVLVGERYVGLDATTAWPSPEAIAAIGPWIDGAEPSPIHIFGGRESAHLRFLLGSALAAPGTALFTDRHSGKWGLKTADLISRELSAGAAQVLALPGPAADILGAWQQGLVAHREIALQLFASSALRSLRGAYGEPGAVISAHRTDPGELRISLSSPFGERDAEGFRCPLFPFERVEDVVKTIADLLDACRVADVTVLPGVHPDRDAKTGLPLFFRADQVSGRQNPVQL